MNNLIYNKLGRSIFSILIIMFIIACGAGGNEGGINDPTKEAQVATATIVATPTDSTDEAIEKKPIIYNLPQAKLAESTGLFASPNRGEWIVDTEIPAGDIVFVMGKNATGSHLRVVWGTGVGWVPVSFTDYNAKKEKMSSLPIFTREPPACAQPLVTQFNINQEWNNTSDQRQRIAVVIDLFRAQYGEFPNSSLSLAVNGKEVESSRRQIVERGQFTLKDVVFTLPDYLYPGDKVGYLLNSTSTEQLAFMATIFSIPENCIWETN